jgi:hypothetical protein
VCDASVEPYTNDSRVMLLAYAPIHPYKCADLLSYLYQEMINESLGPFQLACAIQVGLLKKRKEKLHR